MRASFFTVTLIVSVFFALPIFGRTNNAESIANAIEKMPLRTKIGQMFMVGFQGTSINDGLSDTIQSVSPGGLIVFGRNISGARQLASLLARAQKASIDHCRVPLLLATDQEGGDVIRIKTAIPLPSELALGQTSRPEIAEQAGRATGKLLKTLGFNMNLSPVLDVADPQQATFIGTRTYGSDPELVSLMALKFADGLLSAGILPTAKHFPGHGGTLVDSHTSRAVRQIPRTELERVDLLPFTRFLGVERSKTPNVAVMIGHVAYPKIDPSGAPASFSKTIVSGILRKQIGFDGVVLTDDIGMEGASQIKDPRERVLRSIEAGVDMIMVAWNRRLQRDLVDTIVRAVKNGRIKESRVNESVRRILQAKIRFATTSSHVPSDRELHLAYANPLFDVVAAQTVATRLTREPDREELEFREFASGREVLAFSTNGRFLAAVRGGLGNRKNRVFALAFNRPQDVDRVMRANPNAVGLYYVSGSQVAALASRVSEDVARRMLLVNVTNQSLVTNLASFRHVADVYYRHPSLGRLIAQHYFVDGGAEEKKAALRLPAVSPPLGPVNSAHRP